MRLDARTLLALLTLLLVAFAGCTSDSGDDASGADATDGSDGGDGANGDAGSDGSDGANGNDGSNGSDGANGNDGSNGGDGSDGGAGPDGGDQNQTGTNTPPSATLSASIEQGEVPVLVNFTLDGNDADGDSLTWTFDADEDGTFEAEGTDADLPATVSFNYTTEGVFNATLIVSDGSNETVQTVIINVTAAVAAGPAVQNVSGNWVDSTTSCPHTLLGTYEDAPMDVLVAGSGIAWVTFEIDSATWGGTWTMTADGGPGNLIVELDFYDTSGAYMSYSIDGSGDIPANAGYGVVFPCGAGPGSFEYEGIGPA